MRILPDREQAVINVYRLMVCAIFFAVWEYSAGIGLIDPFYSSKPSDILKDLLKLFVTGEVFPNIAITMEEALAGLAIGTILGIASGFLLGKFERLGKVVDPIIMALYGIPKLALGPIFILWFGLGIESKIFISLISVFFLTFFSAYSGYKNVDPALINAVRLMGATNMQVMSKVIFPSCFPWLLTGLRSSLGVALLGAIVGEYIGANSGLGWMVNYAGGMYDTTRVFSAIIIMTVIMMVLNSGLKYLEDRLLKWRPAVQGQ